MSWMDSWSRPAKSQATPAPFYLVPGGEDTPYCKSCGRVISSRKMAPSNDNKKGKANPVKYCSSRCRGRKVGHADKKIEDAFVAFLNGATTLQSSSANGSGEATVPPGHRRTKSSSQAPKKRTKGDARILVSCNDIEEAVFGPRRREEEAEMKRRSEQQPGIDIKEDAENGSQGVVDTQRTMDAEEVKTGTSTMATASSNDDYDDGEGKDTGGEKDSRSTTTTDTGGLDPAVFARLSIRSGTRIRPSQDVSEVNGSVGGEKGRAERIDEDETMRTRRLEGEKRSEEREQVRRAARRGVVFGFQVSGGGGGDDIDGRLYSKEDGVLRRKCEAVMGGKVVEPSFAKGDWAIRWRE